MNESSGVEMAIWESALVRVQRNALWTYVHDMKSTNEMEQDKVNSDEKENW